MYEQDLRRLGRNPGKMPGAVKLIDCVGELQSVFELTPITDRDRSTLAFEGMTSIAAGMDFADPTQREPYVARWYLRDSAIASVKSGLATGELPVWIDNEGRFVEVEPDLLFLPNRWESTRTLRSGRYQPLNVDYYEEADREMRKESSGKILWVRQEDWPELRSRFLMKRTQRFGSELPTEWNKIVALADLSGMPDSTLGTSLGSENEVVQWTLPEAIMWLASSDEAAVAEQHEAVDHYVGNRDNPWPAIRVGLSTVIQQRFCNCTEKPVDCYCEDEASKALKAACAAGRVSVSGTSADGDSRGSVPATAFTRAELIATEGGALFSEPKFGSELLYRDLHFRASDVRRLTDLEPASRAAAADPIRPPEKAMVEKWYKARIAEAEQHGFTWSRSEDEAAGREIGLTTKRVRELRSSLAKHWPSGGRQSNEQRARKAAFLSKRP